MKIFPIYENKACLLKWTWSSLFLYQGTTASCHRTSLLPILEDDFDNFHNYPARILERKHMLRNQWPILACGYCSSIEETGGISDRLYRLDLIHKGQNHKHIPIELLYNPEATVTTPRQIEVYLSNACNMSCLYCGPHLSSKWVAENKQYGIVNPKFDVYEKEYKGRVSSFFKWLRKNWNTITYLNILGGEPFYQKEYYELLEIIKELPPNPNLDLCIFTNLKIGLGKLKRVTDDLFNLYKMEKVNTVQITISLDCWGEQQEYVRSGMNLKKLEKNLDYLVSLDPWLILSMNTTMNSLSIKTMNDLLLKIIDINKKRNKKLHHSFNLLLDPFIMRPHHFPKDFFSDDFDQILNTMTNENYYSDNAVEYFKGCIKLINESPYSIDAIRKLQTYLDQMDVRHKTNWKTTFPWLTDFK